MVQACEKSSYSSIIKLIPDTSEVKIRVRDSYTIQITPGKTHEHKSTSARAADDESISLKI